MSLYINNQLIARSDYEWQDESIDITIEDENGDQKKAISSEVKLYGVAFDIVNGLIIQNPNGMFEEVTVRVTDDTCCETETTIFTGVIQGKNVDWCHGECSCSVHFIEKTEASTARDCLKSTLIHDNFAGFKNENHPRVKYCIEMRPSIFQDAILIYGISMNIMLTLLTPMIAVLNVIVIVINAVVNALNSLGFNIGGVEFANDETLLQRWRDLRDTLNTLITGCGRVHPSPYARRYFENVCAKCGLQFASSIFAPGSDYRDLVYMAAQVEKGTLDTSKKWIEQNEPVVSGLGFADQMKVVFNAKHRILGNTLYFERRDFFDNGPEWINYEALETSGQILSKVCYSFRDEDLNASARYGYTPEAIDWAGGEAMFRFNDLIGQNSPYSPTQRGIKETIIPFGTGRTRNDHIDRDVLQDYAWFYNLIGQSQGALIMNNGTCMNPKLLIVDVDGDHNAKVRHYTLSPSYPDGEDIPNYPMVFKNFGIADNTAYPQNLPGGNLYTRFYTIDHPKVVNDQFKDFTFAFKYSCSTLTNFNSGKTVTLPIGVGRVTSIKLNMKTKEITVTGKV